MPCFDFEALFLDEDFLNNCSREKTIDFDFMQQKIQVDEAMPAIFWNRKNNSKLDIQKKREATAIEPTKNKIFTYQSVLFLVIELIKHDVCLPFESYFFYVDIFSSFFFFIQLLALYEEKKTTTITTHRWARIS